MKSTSSNTRNLTKVFVTQGIIGIIGFGCTSTAYAENKSDYTYRDLIKASHSLKKSGTRTLKSGQFSKDKLQENISLLNSFSKLPKDWNGYGAEPLSSEIIEKTIELVMSLEYQPIVFPVGDNSVQLEFTSSNGNQLDVEVDNDGISFFIPTSKKEGNIKNVAQLNSILADLFG